MAGFVDHLTARITNLIITGKPGRMSDIRLLEKEIARWKNSPQRIMQIKGHLYFENEHDILTRKRTMIGEDGKVAEKFDGLMSHEGAEGILESSATYTVQSCAAVNSPRSVEIPFASQAVLIYSACESTA